MSAPTQLGVSPDAAPSRRLGAIEFLRQLLDPGTFLSWDVAAPSHAAAPVAYAADLERARDQTGVDEAVLTGEGRIAGRPVAVVVSEFGFLGGSIGKNTADRIVAAIDAAGQRGLPLVAGPASGGTRMQEGTPAFLQMVRITRALGEFTARRLPYLVYLRHPTTGGVFASWGSLGHVTVAEPGALVGFLGPKVYAGLTGEDFPRGVQTAEHLFEHGTVDAVLDAAGFRRLAGEVLGILGAPALETDDDGARRASSSASAGLSPRPTRGHLSPNPRPDLAQRVATRPVSGGPAAPGRPVWDSVLATREPARPGLRELLDAGFARVVRLRGTGRGAGSTSTAVVLAELADASGKGRPVVVVGQDRAAQREGHVLNAAGLAQARRGMRLAQALGLPLVTVIDTPGAELSVRAEEQAIAGGIADCIASMLALSVPTVAVLLGEGTGGGALALAASARTVAAENAWLAPLPPEGASVIVHGVPSRAPELSAAQRISARELFEDGYVHELVPEDAELPVAVALAVARQLAAQG
ncbi:carboxyl transferase domain-containing protein [Sinomonas sp. JGH33]|uniref:Acetyl-coenzyme A carboxylase carboxyl transferase subunits beta/alpha n=1 Tax=Sinomonas terricola TaxID=3110330 RepID=A0ABU5T7S9_9MICC|nr:carboxyl transferase domain-containing protein [Sinomonas sp. JGH33]MEA5455648.1 carboxyl transferase domain-containing protein [Sinomonas sp. JGH33]